MRRGRKFAAKFSIFALYIPRPVSELWLYNLAKHDSIYHQHSFKYVINVQRKFYKNKSKSLRKDVAEGFVRVNNANIVTVLNIYPWLYSAPILDSGKGISVFVNLRNVHVIFFIWLWTCQSENSDIKFHPKTVHHLVEQRNKIYRMLLSCD